MSTADAAIAEQLRDLASGKFDRIVGNKKDRTIIDAFYSGRDYAPLWITDGKVNDRAKAAIAYLGHVDADGLDPADYPVPNFRRAERSGRARRSRAQARPDGPHLCAPCPGRPRALVARQRRHLLHQTAPEPADVLAAMVDAKDVARRSMPTSRSTAGYLALKAKLAEIRAGKADAKQAAIANGPALKVGMQDDRVPQLRERLGVSGDGTTYDKALADAVKKFQQEHQLKVTGTLTPADHRRAQRPPARQADRHHPRQHGALALDAARSRQHLRDRQSCRLHAARDARRQAGWTTRIVDGKPDMPTPIMQAEMKYITVNPTWNVPPSIVNHEYLPALQQDPTVLERMGLKVGNNPDGTVHISQPPGDHNALGRIRFNFPNKFLVYQHDTPDKYLFAYDKRAFSHGCMRVQDPPKYAEVLLSLVRPNDGYTRERIKKMFDAGGEQDIQFPTFIPVNLTYQTAFVDDDGKLQFRDDVYGRDRQLLAILKGDERKMADIAVERREDPSHRQVLAIPDSTPLFGGRGYGSYGGPGDGGSFFSRLFGGGLAATPPAAGAPRGPASPRDQFRSPGPALSPWNFAKNRAGPLTTPSHRPPLLGGLSPGGRVWPFFATLGR